MPHSYPFPVFSGLLEPKHYNRIGNAVWFFIWCISSTTKEEEADGTLWGLVHGSKPMKLSELAEPFGVDNKTVSRWIKTLEQYEYIRVTRAPYGLIIAVRNSKKYLERTDKNVLSLPERVDKNVLSDERERTEMSDLSTTEQTKMSDLPQENGQKCLISSERTDKIVRSNKDIKDLNIITITTTEGLPDSESYFPQVEDSSQAPLIQVLNAYCALHKRLDIHIRQREREIMGRMIAGGVPSPFIIQTMTKLYDEKRRRDEEEGQPFTPPSSFKYYEKAIWEAWRNQNAITPTAPPAGVALGNQRLPAPISAGRQVAGTAETKSEIEELERLKRMKQERIKKRALGGIP